MDSSSPEPADLRDASEERLIAARASWRAAFCVAIGLMALGPVVGVAGTIFGMQRQFDRIEGLRAPTPTDLKRGIHETFVAAGLWILCTGAGTVLLGFSLWRLHGLREHDAHPQDSLA